MTNKLEMFTVSSRRITILTGGYGSGKSELAVNLCVQNARNNGRSCLIDLDILKPMFRSRSLESSLITEGVEVVSGVEGMSEADTPTVSPKINSVLNGDDDCAVIVDVGGDGSGATVLGRYRNEILAAGYGMFLVINPYRPFIRGDADIYWLSDLIQTRSQLEIKGIIANPNLGSETAISTIIDGLDQVRILCEGLNIPIVGLGVSAGVVEDREYTGRLEELGLPVIPVNRRLLAPWEL